MSTRALRPWTELVKLRPDAETRALTEAVFAIDLGAIAAGDPNVPVVNRNPEAFFRATCFAADLRNLLEEMTGYQRNRRYRYAPHLALFQPPSKAEEPTPIQTAVTEAKT
jgi:hypothetical protein